MRQTKPNITIRANKESIDFIRARAKEIGVSSNAYINLLFAKEMREYAKEERDNN